MLSAIAHEMRHSQVLPGYPHSSAGADDPREWCFTCQLLGSTMQTEATACESCHVRIGTYRSPLWLWPTMGQPQKLASIGSQAYVCIQIQSTQGTPQKYPTGVVWGVCVGCVWGEQWSGVCVWRGWRCVVRFPPFPVWVTSYQYEAPIHEYVTVLPWQSITRWLTIRHLSSSLPGIIYFQIPNTSVWGHIYN